MCHVEKIWILCNFASGKAFKMNIINHHLLATWTNTKMKNLPGEAKWFKDWCEKEMQNPRILSGRTTHYKICRVHLPEWHGYWLDTVWILTIVGPDIAFTKFNWQCVQKGLPANNIWWIFQAQESSYTQQNAHPKKVLPSPELAGRYSRI